jgi:hypothetical protein
MSKNKYLEKIAVSTEWIQKNIHGSNATQERLQKFMDSQDHKVRVHSSLMNPSFSPEFNRYHAESTHKRMTAHNAGFSKKMGDPYPRLPVQLRVDHGLPKYEPTVEKPLVGGIRVEKPTLVERPSPAKQVFKLGTKGKIGLGIGAAGALGLGAYALSRKKDMSS